MSALLVIGRTGQVARELARRAPDAAFLSRAEADLATPGPCADAIRAMRPRAVINAAAYTAVDRAESEEALATAVNGHAPGAMAEACADLDIPFVHISTDYVFDGSGVRPWRTVDPVGPVSAYGRSKLVGERAVRRMGGLVLRTSWVFSAHGANFVKTMLRLSETRERLTIVSDQVGGPTPAADIADACLGIVRRLRDDPGAAGLYHYSGAPDASWADFAREIFAQSRRATAVEDIPTEAFPTPAARPRNSRLDCTATQATFGIERPDWRRGLSEVLSEMGVPA